ncbi:hypothetical protein CENSYa_1819 [Cenarchaeum symbiosum A]|uniref:Uncharacterized protein n=1 Tax=Cenarchaeum symbiosum (strain A) TaxID=414004 RepID=A0RYL2_CENSY|nr:hypothetical protein CENSYa_1819 [Cenarchaeum symbiosum A]
MVLVDKRILFGGVAMLAVGLGIVLYINATYPIGTPGMSEDAAMQLEQDQRVLDDYRELSGIMMGLGFLLILISFGARRKRRDRPVKKEKKPAE